MKTWIRVFLLMATISLLPLNIYGQTPFEFPEVNGHFITQIGDDHYLVVEDLLISGEGFWAIWKLNKTNGNWDIILAGEPASGEKSASGNFFYDSFKEIMIWEIRISSFLGCGGLDAGTHIFSSDFSEPSLKLLAIELGAEDDEDVIELEMTRVSGSPGLIYGQWSLIFGSNSYLFNFNADGTMLVSGNVKDCLMD
ncbi:MAG: hypothetical protein R6U27_16785 [Desulfobacterales bacterium]